MNSETVETLAQFSDDEDGHTDAQFCAHARQLIPLLLDVVDVAITMWEDLLPDLDYESEHGWAFETHPLGVALKSLDAYAAKLGGGK